MNGNALRRRTTGAVATLLLTGATTVVMTAVLPSAAHASAACHTGANSIMPDYDLTGSWGSTGDLKYPAVLHGKKIHLYTDRGNASAYAKGENLSKGDILSIDRSNWRLNPQTEKAEHYWLSTAKVGARGTYDYCEKKITSAGTQSTPRIDGAHRAVRPCLRHKGALQCTNVWYADNDDNPGDWT